MTYMAEPFARQQAREQEMKERGMARARTQQAKAEARGDSASTQAGVALAKRAVAPLAQAIRSFLGEAYSGKAGRRNAAAAMLVDVDPELAAFVTIRAAINAASRKWTLKRAAGRVAGALEMELLGDAFEEANGVDRRELMTPLWLPDSARRRVDARARTQLTNPSNHRY
jgi:DNA-directed RNA polymerase